MRAVNHLHRITEIPAAADTMADSLRDQLLKSGLVQKLKSEAQATGSGQRQRKAGKGEASRQQSAPRRREHGKPATDAGEMDLARAYGLRERSDREERELERKQAELRAREKAERKQKLAELLAGRALNHADADIARHFPHGGKIRRVYCTAEQLKQVNEGILAVVQHRGHYLLVNRETAEQVRAISGDALVLLCDPNEAADDGVPPDLVW